MECEVCGHELNLDGTCDYCRQTRSVRVMERWEDADYAETTIEDVELVDEGRTGERPQEVQAVRRFSPLALAMAIVVSLSGSCGSIS